ncbi:hypothetical protein Sjap_015240 [Stephania japonica]|uniref:Uncharacterized protein n=1 Tax=Stephania japonica TaxID=461633 RepID=A0AAP0IIV9_9MAGN
MVSRQTLRSSWYYKRQDLEYETYQNQAMVQLFQQNKQEHMKLKNDIDQKFVEQDVKINDVERKPDEVLARFKHLKARDCDDLDKVKPIKLEDVQPLSYLIDKVELVKSDDVEASQTKLDGIVNNNTCDMIMVEHIEFLKLQIKRTWTPAQVHEDATYKLGVIYID